MWLSSLLLTTALSMMAMQDSHGCQEQQHHPDDPCLCTIEVDFYRPGSGHGPGGPGGPGGGGGPVVRVDAPGYRVIGRPIHVAGPVVHISGPPIYVDAPPVYVAPAQIYIERPDVIVRPSDVIVAPPVVNVEPCPNGQTCGAIGALSGQAPAGYAPAGPTHDGERG